MIEIALETVPDLVGYSSVSAAFDVREILDVTAALPIAAGLTVRQLSRPYRKDYDAVDGERPIDWPSRFDLSSWAFFKASMSGVRVGGAAVARSIPGVDMFEGRTDLAVLYDIRAASSARCQGVGSALFDAAVAWAAAQGCRELKVETQDTNAAACRFYARQGCDLRAVHRGAYPLFPDELQLLWYKTLVHDGAHTVAEQPPPVSSPPR